MPRRDTTNSCLHCTRLNSTYRVVDPSCHPLISLCPRIYKNNIVQNLPPQKSLSSEFASPKLNKVVTKFLDSAISRGWQVLNLVISGGGQFRTLLFLCILGHREIRGWHEGSTTLYIGGKIISWNIYRGPIMRSLREVFNFSLGTI